MIYQTLMKSDFAYKQYILTVCVVPRIAITNGRLRRHFVIVFAKLLNVIQKRNLELIF